MHDPEKDYEHIAKHIQRFEVLISEQKSSKQTLKRYQTLLDGTSSHYKYSDSIGYLYAAFYELQALIYISKDDIHAAIKFLNEAVDVKQNDQGFISATAQSWYTDQQAKATAASIEQSEQRYHQTVGSKKFSKRTKIILWSVLGVIILLAAISGPLSDYLTIKNANPTMLKLAQDAGMTRQGELVFLRTNPQLVNDTDLAQACPNAQNGNNGFIEQGCFVPNQSNPTTGRIYIRQMSSDLYNLEVTTAAYEMLHPAYIGLTQQSDGGAALNKNIESDAASLSDNDLQAQIANFAKIEPGAKDLELFSILGTEYSGISSDLASYYSPYLKDLSSIVSMNSQVSQTFQDDKNQLISLQNTIDQTDATAKTAYRNSISWADAGNQYEDNYNYNIYSKDIDLENSYIDQYNTLLTQYNILVDEYNGQQFNSDAPVQSTQQ